jgi:hypothetical protein
MFRHFLSSTKILAEDSLLDVGVTSERSYEASNYVEAWYPYKSKITAVGLDDATFLEEIYPGVRFVTGDGRDLPFEDHSFDVVHSSAVLEHVGSFEQQVRFISECARVARKAVYLTTPNRWFPVEFHTVLPLVHWLPASWFRAVMKRTGRAFFAEEANLNLMGRADLKRAANQALPPGQFGVNIEAADLLGWPSNLLLCAHRL